MKEEEKIAEKVNIDLKYPKWDKDRMLWECTCGKRMVPRPFGLWKTETINRMYQLRIRQRDKILDLIESIFSEGFFNYFYTTYGSDNRKTNEEMTEDIDKKLKELKQKIKEMK